MKKLFYLAALLLAVCTTAFSQTQMNNWYIGPKKINMTVSAPTPATITPVIGTAAAATAGHVANGFYDNSGTGNMLFYIVDGTVYDYNNTIIGTVPSGGAEIAIVPFGTNGTCQNKYNIFSTSGGVTSPTAFWQTVLDMNSYSLSTVYPPLGMQYGTEFGALAVGKVFGASLDRYLYFMAGSGTVGTASGQIYKAVLHNNGSVSPLVLLYPNPAIGVNNANAGGDVFSKELELSPDGKWLAWASYSKGNVGGGFPTQNRYHFVALNTNGDLDIATYGTTNVYQQFNITGANYNLNNTGFRGVEFNATSSKLFMGAGTDGIFSTNIGIPFTSSFTQVGGSNNTNLSLSFGFSQIELANNGYMYASSLAGGGGINIGAFDPTVVAPQILGFPNSFAFTNPPNDVYSLGGSNPNSTLYTLPDQIDGQNYSTIVQPPVTSVTTASTYTYNPGSTALQTWTAGTNPFSNSSTVYITQYLIIGGTSHENLKITGMTFKFSPTAKVIIKPGCTLTLDNTTFTSMYKSECGSNYYTWKGVEVWGNTSANQNGTGTSLAQGKLTMTNSSKIEYAEIGAAAQNPNDATQRGGIIISLSNSIFLNCNMDIKFLPYHNMVGSIEYGNKSYFSTANFQNNGLYPFTTAPIHSYIDNCRGIRFYGCHFTNFNSQQMFNMPSMGIKSMNANFTVTSGSTFSNLYHAIDANQSGGTNNFSVYSSTFEDNEVGIYNYNVNNFIVQQCTLKIGGNQRGASFHYGIRNFYGTGFTIEENNFQLSSVTSSANKLGVLITSAGTAANEVYKNTFTGITYGNYSNGQNRDNSPNGNIQGLQWLCNTNIGNNLYDFYVSGSGTNVGVRLFQGTSTYPAGNTFTHWGTSFSDFNNNTSVALNYYYKSSIAAQSPIFFNALVIPISTGSYSNSCPSHICDPPCAQAATYLSSSQVQQLYTDFNDAESAYLNLLYSYNQLMDGGNTNALLNQMQQTWSTDAVQFRDELLARSPYLSQDILREAANRNILPDAMMLMVCLANPDATRGDEFIKFLQYECPNPLPQYMIDLIISSWDDGTARTAMENMLATYNQSMATASNRILSDLYNKRSLDIDSIDPNDTTNISCQIVYWLNRIQTLSAKYDLIEYYSEANDWNTSDSLLNLIPYDFRLTEEQLSTYNDYVYFYNFRKAHVDNGGELSELDETEIQELVEFTQRGENFATGLAQNVLCFYYGICRDDELRESSGNRVMYNSSAATSVNLKETANDNIITVAPNPAINEATFSYYLPSVKEKPTLRISDITGKEIIRFTLTNDKGELKWDTSKINSGMYYYNAKDGNTVIAKGKISVKK